MKLSQKRTCSGCYLATSTNKNCEADYKTKSMILISGASEPQKPLEPCYKPITYREQMNFRNIILPQLIELRNL